MILFVFSAPKHGPSDYGAHSRSIYAMTLYFSLLIAAFFSVGSFTTTDAPWNVTQWIDPLDPHPKLTTMPILIVIRK